MQYILEESEIKGLLLCKKYIQELYDSLSQNIENNPDLKNNNEIMDNYKKYKEALEIPHPFILK